MQDSGFYLFDVVVGFDGDALALEAFCGVILQLFVKPGQYMLADCKENTGHFKQGVIKMSLTLVDGNSGEFCQGRVGSGDVLFNQICNVSTLLTLSEIHEAGRRTMEFRRKFYASRSGTNYCKVQ